jgi:ABC-type amino acid transport substrate-binding protein
MRPNPRFVPAAALVALLPAFPSVPARAAAKPGAEFTESVRKPFTGDLDGMLERRRVRILVVPSQTGYFVDKGTQRGITYDAGRAFEDELNKKRKKGSLHVEVVFVPVSRNEILKALVNGQGDIAAATSRSRPSARSSSILLRRTSRKWPRSSLRDLSRPRSRAWTIYRARRSSCGRRAATSRASGT